jgi:glutamyl-tRNA synthetase
VNYLALLGWGPPDGQEVRLEPLSLTDGFPTMFDISDVSSSPAFFDVKKLLFVNGEHLRAMSIDALDEAAQPFLEQSSVGPAYGSDAANRDRFRQLLPEVQTRVETLSEVPGYVDFLFAEPEVDQKAWDKAMTADAAGWLDAVIAAAQDWPWEAEQLHERFMALAEELEANRRKFQAPVRVALTGRSVGPPLFESMVVLGRDVVLERLRVARGQLDAAG